MPILLFLVKFILPMALGIIFFSKQCQVKYSGEFIAKIFLISFVVAVFSALMNYQLNGGPVDYTVLRPLIEEAGKYVIMVVLIASEWFTEPMDGVLIGLLAGLGFGMYDLFLASFHADWLVYLKRAFLDLPMQALTLSIVGYAVAREHFKLNQGKPYIGFNHFALVIFLHVLYNYAGKQALWGAVVILALIWVIFTKKLAWAFEHRIRPNLEIDDSKGDIPWKEGFQ